MNNMAVKTKKALVLNKKRVTDFLWNDIKRYGFVTVCEGDDILASFDTSTGRELFRAYKAKLYYESSDRPFIKIKFDEASALYSLTGDLIIPLGKYDGFYFCQGHIFISKQGKEGLCTFDGRELLPPRYLNISVYGNLIIASKKYNSEFAIFSYKNSMLTELERNVDNILFDGNDIVTVKGNEYNRYYYR